MVTSPDLVDRLLAWAPAERALSRPPVERVLAWGPLDFRPSHRLPAWPRVALATALAVVLSLAADAALVAVGTAVFPATNGYVHFQFADYAKLTVIGVFVAGAAWPLVVRVSSSPRRLFFRAAIAVTLVLFLPDVWIWLQGESAQAVAVLLAMHVAIAVVTYNLLVHLAPVRAPARHDAATRRTAGV